MINKLVFLLAFAFSLCAKGQTTIGVVAGAGIANTNLEATKAGWALAGGLLFQHRISKRMFVQYSPQVQSKEFSWNRDSWMTPPPNPERITKHNLSVWHHFVTIPVTLRLQFKHHRAFTFDFGMFGSRTFGGYYHSSEYTFTNKIANESSGAIKIEDYISAGLIVGIGYTKSISERLSVDVSLRNYLDVFFQECSVCLQCLFRLQIYSKPVTSRS